jgi:type IV secretory pathway VirB10-like protein
MTYFPPERPIGDEPRSTKAPAESMLAAPRLPVTRWNRRYLVAGAGALAALVAAGFYIGFGGASRPARKQNGTQTTTDAAPATPAFASRYAAGYGDPAVRAIDAPGTAVLPPPGATAAGNERPPPAAQARVDPAVQRARAQVAAARGSGPFFAVQAPAADGAAEGSAPAALAEAQSGPSPATALPATPSPDVQPANGQGGKARFLASARTEDYLASPLRPPLSPWEVKAGTVIPAALITALNSDLPGEVIAQVTEPVYDHATGLTVLIPQGSRLIGRYDSQIAYGQQRALIAWNRIVMPDGRSINIGSMSGGDLTGAAGLMDRVDGHFWQLARGIVLSTVFSVGAAGAQDASARGSGALVLNSAASGVSTGAEQVGQRITERDLSRQPTLEVRAGWPLRVLVDKDMILAPYP